MKITVNDKAIETKSKTIYELINELNFNNQFLAIAKNDNIIAKSNWGTELIKDGDIVDIVSPVGGG